MIAEPLRRKLSRRIPLPPRRQHGVIISADGSTVTVMTDRGVVVVQNASVTRVGTPVILEEVDGQWIIVGIWRMALPTPSPDFSLVPGHHQNHELFHPDGGDDVVWVQKQQFLPLLVYPTDPPSLSVQVYSTTVYTGKSFIVVESAQIDLAEFVPDNNPAWYVVVLDTIRWEISGIVGSEGEGLPEISSTAVPLAAILLTPGVAAVGWDSIHDLRQLPAIQSSIGDPEEIGLWILLFSPSGTEEAPVSPVIKYPPTVSGLVEALADAGELTPSRISLPPLRFEPEEDITIPSDVTVLGNGAEIAGVVTVEGVAVGLSATQFIVQGRLIQCREGV